MSILENLEKNHPTLAQEVRANPARAAEVFLQAASEADALARQQQEEDDRRVERLKQQDEQRREQIRQRLDREELARHNRDFRRLCFDLLQAQLEIMQAQAEARVATPLDLAQAARDAVQAAEVFYTEGQRALEKQTAAVLQIQAQRRNPEPAAEPPLAGPLP